MAKQIYREKSLKYISSPEQLNDYLKVTKPAVWAVLAAVVLLLVGLLVWSSFAYIASSVNGVAEVDDGKMVVEFSDARYSSNVEEGMSVVVGDKEIPIVSVGRNDKGNVFAVADTDLEDGTYDVTVTYKQTQVLGLLFGN
ncbi:MAG: hypothetical protein IJU77_00800 [Butyrivibrio sp.]|nr:hypothetical protein [Butyrivibrio sp.]